MSPQWNLKPNILFYNGYQHDDARLETCNYAGDDCWKVRVHPRIDEVNFDTGYITGGQNIKIYGHGFNGTNVSVTIDGVACDVNSVESSEIQCTTSVKESESVLGYQPGQPGMERRIRGGTAFWQL